MDTASARVAIGALSKRTGSNVETIRYYERIGLLPFPARSAGGYRLYGMNTSSGSPSSVELALWDSRSMRSGGSSTSPIIAAVPAPRSASWPRRTSPTSAPRSPTCRRWSALWRRPWPGAPAVGVRAVR
jgi:MerR family regulatory protein